ncbi:MAG TPA: MBL fold metallo-hydrolase [Balneolales bacterium]|nr:MBL fold metallo-hydrolase [Balneolales bacterium]
MIPVDELCESPINKIIYPIRIPTPFPVGDVNIYVIMDEKNILVDTGPKTPKALQILREELDKLDLSFKDLDEIWLTHGHPDHFGLVTTILRESNATVFGHPDDIINFDYNRQLPHFLHFFREHKIPEEFVSVFVTQFHWYASYLDKIVPDVWLEDDNILKTGNHNFKILHLPGHAPGHVGFLEQNGVLLGGDVLIKHITSNALVSFDDETGERTDNLLSLRNSMSKVGEVAKCVLPGHGVMFHNVAEVAESHLDAQDERYHTISRSLDEPLTLLDITQKIFRGAVTPEKAFLPVSEIIGYLDWGIRVGSISTFREDGYWYYVRK